MVYNLFFVIFLSLADHDVYSHMNLLLQRMCHEQNYKLFPCILLSILKMIQITVGQLSCFCILGKALSSFIKSVIEKSNKSSVWARILYKQDNQHGDFFKHELTYEDFFHNLQQLEH